MSDFLVTAMTGILIVDGIAAAVAIAVALAYSGRLAAWRHTREAVEAGENWKHIRRRLWGMVAVAVGLPLTVLAWWSPAIRFWLWFFPRPSAWFAEMLVSVFSTAVALATGLLAWSVWRAAQRIIIIVDAEAGGRDNVMGGSRVADTGGIDAPLHDSFTEEEPGGTLAEPVVIRVEEIAEPAFPGVSEGESDTGV